MFKMVKALGLSLAFACGFTSLVGAGSSVVNAAESLPLEGTALRVGMAITPPFVMVGNTFEDVRGIDYELIKELQRRTGFTIANDKIEILNFGQMMNLGAEGTLDIVTGGINLTAARAKLFEFSEPYYRAGVAVVGRRGANITSFQSLQNHKIAIVAGTNAGDIMPKGVSVSVLEVPSNFMAFYNVAYNNADVAIADIPLAQDFIDNLLGKNLEIKFVLPDSAGDMGLLFAKKHPEVNRILNQNFTAMIKDGTVAKIVSKFSSDAECNITLNRLKKDKAEKIVANNNGDSVQQGKDVLNSVATAAVSSNVYDDIKSPTLDYNNVHLSNVSASSF